LGLLKVLAFSCQFFWTTSKRVEREQVCKHGRSLYIRVEGGGEEVRGGLYHQSGMSGTKPLTARRIWAMLQYHTCMENDLQNQWNITLILVVSLRSNKPTLLTIIVGLSICLGNVSMC
jgi:hypothetical protein